MTTEKKPDNIIRNQKDLETLQGAGIFNPWYPYDNERDYLNAEALACMEHEIDDNDDIWFWPL